MPSLAQHWLAAGCSGELLVCCAFWSKLLCSQLFCAMLPHRLLAFVVRSVATIAL
jgi:hypothetical protein